VPIYDYVCDNCSLEEEHIEPIDREQIPCGHCNGTMHRIFSPGGSAFNQDAAWIRSVLEVVAKDSTKPATREFVKNPTRENMQRWMRSEGIRHLENGEKAAKIDYDADHRRRTEYAERRHFERKSITVRG
jgi:putative FmdB family regulatory protein